MIAYTFEDINTVARTAWAEARGEGPLGMRAVVWVIHNRWADKRWPKTYAGVCQQRRQFSCWNKTDPNRAKLLKVDFEDHSFRVAYGIAAAIMAGMEQDVTGQANHYHADYLDPPPNWANPNKLTCRIYRHIYFRL